MTGPAVHPSFTGVHRNHALHRDPDGEWIDANCYTDVWVELLHGLGLDPYPVLVAALRLDFEGDQWTFFKPAVADLQMLYGIDVIELAPYGSLAEQAGRHLRRGDIMIMEADAYHLPDTPTTYHRTHSKTTVAVVAVDLPARTARYLHNADCFTVYDEDFDGLFRLGVGEPPAGHLPPYLELVKLNRVRRRPEAELRALAGGLALEAGGAPDRAEAMSRFVTAFDDEIRRIVAAGQTGFGDYAFVTLRQLGAGCALAAKFLRWLGAAAPGDPELIAEACDSISRCAKRLIMKSARATATGRRLDGTATYAEIVAAWHRMLINTERNVRESTTDAQ
ncbi:MULTISPECIES: DUF1839 family protein [Actinoplanes]|uniref:DUF1839 family protein n=1 Tax=Actinoplanes TaxID=1865 RepID=UPI000696C5E0|nr:MULTISPECIES: DUF1839 family protein [Actinoplanes]GLY02731.1 hypothetical protein Acsp01_31100 [Actinoplanes sp. NBRC 101535]